MLQKIEKLIQKLKEKGQGVVEYALLLGFVAIVLAYFTSTSGLTKQTEDSMTHMNEQAKSVVDQYTATPT